MGGFVGGLGVATENMCEECWQVGQENRWLSFSYARQRAKSEWVQEYSLGLGTMI